MTKVARTFIFCLVLCLSVLTVHAQKIYFTDNGAVRRMNLNGTSVETIVPGGGYDYIAVDGYGGFLFYNDGQDSYRSYLDGSNPALLTSDGAMAGYNNIEVVPDEQTVLFVGIGEIGEVYAGSYFMDPDAGEYPTSFTGALSEDEFLDIAYNVDDGRLYFSGTDGWIYTCYTNGSGMSQIIGTDAYGPIAVDYDEGRIYWVRYAASNHYIMRSNLDGSGTVTIRNNGTNAIESIEVYPQADAIFFTQWNGVFRVNRDGTDFETLYTGTNIRTLAVDVDILPPGHSSFSPTTASLNVPVDANLTISFDERVKKSSATGTPDDYSFRIYKTTGDELVETLDRSSSNVSVSGQTVTLNLTADLDYNTSYYVLAGNKTVADLTDNDWAGIGLISVWRFTTEPDESIFYSLQDGNWNDPNTWSHEGHTGAAATSTPGTGSDVIIGSGHTVSLTGTTSVVANSDGTIIKAGGTLNANGHEFSVWGKLTVEGTIENPGILSGTFELHATGVIPVFSEIHYGVSGIGGTADIYTNVVALNGIQAVSGGVINTNGFEICVPPTPPPTSPVFSNITQTSITLGWTTGSGQAFVVAREGSTDYKPAFGQAYTADASFGDGDAVGTGNYVVHAGTGNTVTITGLTPATTYEFDLYSFSTTIGGCYSVHNYESATATACPVLTAPTGAVNAQYCTGDTKPALNVASPGSGKRIRWYNAATGGTLVAGDDTGGTGLGEVFIPNAPSGTFYAEVYDEVTFCTSNTRTAVTLTLHPPLSAGTATGDQDICVGEDPVTIDGGTAAGGTGAFTYTWESSLAPGGPYTDIVGATSVTYDPPAGLAQTTYFRRVTRSSTCVQPGNAIVVNVVSQPGITLQPENTSVCTGDGISFYVEATGTSLTYQWQVDNGSGFSNISDGGVYSGTATNQLEITNTTGLNNFRYRCIISASGGCPVESDVAILQINSIPAVVNQTQTLCEVTPGSGVAVVDLNALNSAVVGGSSGYNVEWYSDAALNTPIVNPENASASNGMTFHARIVSNATECQNTATATVNVSSKPSGSGTISGPSSLCANEEGTYVISGISSGTSFQWQVPAGLEVVSRNGSTAIIRGTAAGSGTISVTGENTCGTGGNAAMDIEVRSSPTVVLAAPVEAVVGEPASFSYSVSSGNIQNAVWNFGDQNSSNAPAPEHTFTTDGTFTVSLTATDALGCQAVETANVIVLPVAELSDTSIKNVITANGDNSNGLLYIENIEKYPSNEVVLLDRWGVEVFRKENYLNDWDARRSDGDFLPAGQYICVVKLNETGKVFSRTVSIIKR